MAFLCSLFSIPTRYLIFYGLPILYFLMVYNEENSESFASRKNKWCYPYSFHDWVWQIVWAQLLVCVFVFLMFLGIYFVFTSNDIYWSLSMRDALWFVFFLIPLLTFGYLYFICLIKMGFKSSCLCGIYLLIIGVTMKYRIEIMGYVFLTSATVFLIRCIEEYIDIENLF